MKWEKISVFISSTFNDMHAERDLLVKKVFPELSEWCSERRLRLYDIDLRWGVTEDESQNNNTVEVCLKNIDNCRPFFLCFIGQRRGWIPESFGKGAIDTYPQLKAKAGKRSVTELEIEHALLSPMIHVVNGERITPNENKEAVFFIRDSAYLSALSEKQKDVYTNSAAADEHAEDALQREFTQKVREISDHVFDYSCRFDGSLSSPELISKGEELAQGRLTDFKCAGVSLHKVILDQLKKQIISAYPERAETSSDTSISESDTQLRNLEQTAEGTLERVRETKLIDDYCKEPGGKPLYVYGGAGSGKSCLLSLFYQNHHESYVSSFMRFCGISPGSLRFEDIWRGVDSLTGGDGMFSADDCALHIEKILERLSKEGSSLIVIDGLDKSESGISALSAVPSSIPENIRLILSFRSDKKDAYAAVEHARSTCGAVLCPVQPLDPDSEIPGIVRLFLENYLKALSDEQLELLCSIPAAKNPLFLKILLCELRVFGTFEGLKSKISSYGDSPKSAFTKLLNDLCAEISYTSFSPERFVPALLSALSVCRTNIPVTALKAALLHLLGGKSEDIDETCAFYIRKLRPYLYYDGVTIGIAYHSMKEAASELWQGMLIGAHKALAAVLEIDDPLECLYHLRAAGCRERISALTASPRFLTDAIQVSGAYSLSEELSLCAEYVNGDVLECIRRMAPIVNKNGQTAAALFYKELPSPIREEALPLLKKPWLKYEPVELSPPETESDNTLSAEFSVEHSITGFAVAEKRKLAFAFEASGSVRIIDLTTGKSLGHVRLPNSVGEIKKAAISPGGETLAVADYDRKLHLLSLALSEEGKPLGITQRCTDNCVFIRFGGVCLSSSADGVMWQRDTGEVVEYNEQSGTIRTVCSSGGRLTMCCDDILVFKGTGAYMLFADGYELRFSARINDCIRRNGRLYVACEDNTVSVIDAGIITAKLDLPGSIISLTLMSDSVIGADRYGSLIKITSDNTIEDIGRIVQGDDIIDMDTKLIGLDDNSLCFFSMQRLAILRQSAENKPRLMKASRGRKGVSVIWSRKDSFFVQLSDGGSYDIPYPKMLLTGNNVNKLNNLKIACSDSAAVYESDFHELTFINSRNNRRLKIDSYVCDLKYSPDTDAFAAVVQSAKLLEIDPDANILSSADLPKSDSDVYLLCCCKKRKAVLCRRVQIKENAFTSSVLEDVIVMIEKGRTLWKKRISRYGESGRIGCLTYDESLNSLLVYYENRIEQLSSDSGETIGSTALKPCSLIFIYGGASIDGVVYGQTGFISDNDSGIAIETVCIDDGTVCSLPSHRRIKAVCDGADSVIIQEGNEKIYRVKLIR
ncbi:MAG: DUF4062 domain-containing protein [Ruminococcus sp.]|nr:DUF4062 domain-containing protein [Ruminococcus sp.]